MIVRDHIGPASRRDPRIPPRDYGIPKISFFKADFRNDCEERVRRFALKGPEIPWAKCAPNATD